MKRSGIAEGTEVVKTQHRNLRTNGVSAVRRGSIIIFSFEIDTHAFWLLFWAWVREVLYREKFPVPMDRDGIKAVFKC